jgi:exopolysaccharide biosynthesis polyprenyl glycosylphosphotransferase
VKMAAASRSLLFAGGAGEQGRWPDSPPRSRRVRLAALPSAGDAFALAVAAFAAGQADWQAAAYVTGVLLSLSLSGLHRLRICLRVSDQAGRILAVVALPVLLILPWTTPGSALRLVAWSAGAVLAVRCGGYAVIRAAHRRGRLTESAMLVGAGRTGEQIATLLCDHPELGLRPYGFLDTRPPADGLTWPVLGHPAELREAVVRGGIKRVIVCFPEGRDEDLVPVLRTCRELHVDVCVVPRLHELGAAVPRACLDEVWGIPLIPLRQGRTAMGAFSKRAFDCIAAAVLLVVLAPLLGALTLVIRLRRRHSVFFRQVRVTGGGRSAEIVKFRTLGEHNDADTCWVVPTRQVTPLGQWLRTTHLDELPQLVNVLRGEMSLVGPRPERPYFAEQFGREIPRYDDRNRMSAGLTGWAQVHGLHGDTSIHDRVRFDNAYIENWSFWLDLMILARTLAAALPRSGNSAETGSDLKLIEFSVTDQMRKYQVRSTAAYPQGRSTPQPGLYQNRTVHPARNVLRSSR